MGCVVSIIILQSQNAQRRYPSGAHYSQLVEWVAIILASLKVKISNIQLSHAILSVSELSDG